MKSRSETIRRYGKTLSALVLSITLSGGIVATNSVYAASDDTTATQTQTTSKWSKGLLSNSGKRGGQGQGAQGFQSAAFEQKLADYLKLSLADLREKQKTQTLAEIAASLNIGRDTLKAQLVAWIEAALPTNASSSTSSSQDKPAIDASTIAEKMLDSKGAAFKGGNMKGSDFKGKGGKAGFGFRIATDKLASLIGITADQLKEQQEAGKTVAEIAEANGVTRDALKTKLVAWLDENKPAAAATDSDSATTDTKKQPTWDSSAIADQILDSSPGKDGNHERGIGGGFGLGKAYDSADIATVLGVTEDELKTALESGQTIADVAASKGVAVDTVEQVIVTALKAKLDTELSSGKITQEQYNKQADQLSAIAEKIVNAEFDKQAKGGAPGDRGRGGFGIAHDSAAIATVLGITEDELKTALQSGQSIADVASSKGVAVDTVVQALVAAMKTKLDTELSSGKITQEQYDKQTAQLTTIAEKFVNGTMAAGGKEGKQQHEKHAKKAETAASAADTSTSA